MQHAVDFIEEHLTEKINAETVAEKAYMSSFHFQRLFSIFFGISMGEYVRNRKLSLAAEEIMTSDTRIIDIAFKYGYETPESFSRAFYRYFNETPTTTRSKKSSLTLFPQISVKSILSGDNQMTELSERGYSVIENRPVYYTQDMDATVKWFKEILGWFGGIDARDNQGKGIYGCVLPVPGELVHMKVTEFNGIHLFPGEPSNRVEGFMMVDSIEKLSEYVHSHGWEEISSIEHQPWGARSCNVTSIDGTVITFFELD